jgi:hypothetical protein
MHNTKAGSQTVEYQSDETESCRDSSMAESPCDNLCLDSSNERNLTEIGVLSSEKKR